VTFHGQKVSAGDPMIVVMFGEQDSGTFSAPDEFQIEWVRRGIVIRL
jgi:hypothetical protein